MSSALPPINFKRNNRCFCESGQRFKHCCGSTRPDRATPSGICIVEDFLSPSECQAIVAIAATLPSERLKIMDLEKTTAEKVVRRFDEHRVTERVQMQDNQGLLDTNITRAVENIIAPALNSSFDWFEQPHLLRYRPGGFYANHADSESIDQTTGDWGRVIDRDISVLLYLDDNFEGGELLFGNFEYAVKPKPGMLVYFPSDRRYMHCALPVTSGQRHAIVSWLAQRGVDKMREAPEDATLL
ncbi:MAG: putative 2-oxoglutarate/Fe(II)-dependent dioxygenase YbiX [Halioglobus sp.]|jgi:predicted 2-oxoglutarate/Fe(II)-dependent dioxygenase YbiX